MPLVALIPIAIGALTGLVGIGGGFLFVPALVLLARVPMRHAVGTSLVVIAMNAAAGFAGYIGHVPIPWGFVGTFVTAAIVGVFGGVWLVRVVPQLYAQARVRRIPPGSRRTDVLETGLRTVRSERTVPP